MTEASLRSLKGRFVYLKSKAGMDFNARLKPTR